MANVKTCPLCHAEHPSSCHFADTNAWPLYVAATAKLAAQALRAALKAMPPKGRPSIDVDAAAAILAERTCSTFSPKATAIASAAGLDALDRPTLTRVLRSSSARELAKTIGIASENLSRIKSKALRGARHGDVPHLDLEDQVRFNVVQFLLDKPVHLPPPVQGARHKAGSSRLDCNIDADTIALLNMQAKRYEGASSGIADAALALWVARYGDKPRSSWPAPTDGETGVPRHFGVDPAVSEKFDLAIGGPGWRRFYAPTAIAEYVRELERVAQAEDPPAP